MYQRRSIFLIILLSLAGATAPVQTGAQTSDDLEKTAAEAYQAKQWSEAAKAYKSIVDGDDSNGRAWYRLGVSSRYTGEYDTAVDALAKAEAAGVPIAYTKVELAKVHIAAGDNNKAVAELESAVAGGFPGFQALETDDGLVALRGDPAYAKVIDGAKRNAMPCEYDARFNDFDFWVGEWEVSDKASTQVYGHNRIEKSENNCLMTEHWSSAGGGGGTSMNYYNPSTGLWTQNWVSGGGLVIDISGGLKDSSMVLTGTAYYAAGGTKFPFRGTWTPQEDGRVRQFFEQSSDDGATWATWFDGYYAHKTGE